MKFIKYIKTMLVILVSAILLTTSNICNEMAEAQPIPTSVQEITVQKEGTSSALDIVNSPKNYLNKTVIFNAKFDKFSTLGLDYKPAFKSSEEYISFLIKREDTSFDIPLSEMKLFVKRDEAEKTRNEALEKKRSSKGTDSALDDKKAYRDANKDYRKAKKDAKAADQSVKNTQRKINQNKINNIKSKMYQVAHPVDATKERIKDIPKNTAKKVANKAGRAIANTGKKALKASINSIKTFFLTLPPQVRLVAALTIIIFIIMFILIIASYYGTGDNSVKEAYGLYGYEYVAPKCTEITIEGGEYSGVYDIEEYIAGVTSGEFGVFIGNERHEAAKAGAIAARSFVQANVGEDCTVISSESFQVYKTPSESAIEVANETRGLVLTDSSGNIKSTQYDAFCTDSPQDDPDNYIVCQKNQLIPREWVDNEAGIADSWKTGERNGAHGNGMSAWGAAYLAEQGYSFEEILEYYYDDTELKSIYQSFVISNNWTIAINDTSSSQIQTTISTQPLNSILSRTEYNELNNLIYESVMDFGIGTRDAVVAAAVTPIKYLAENHGVLIPYTYGGGHYMALYRKSDGENLQKTTATYFGVDPDWGTNIKTHYFGGYGPYYYYGPDCSAWAAWVFYNAGVYINNSDSTNFENHGKNYDMDGSYIATPGDVIVRPGHVEVIVGVDEPNKTYYTAEAKGGDYGVVVETSSFYSDDSVIVDMTEYLENHKNSNYETSYGNGVLEY